MSSFSSPTRRPGRKSADNHKQPESAQTTRRLALVKKRAKTLSTELMPGVAILNAELRYVEISDGLAKLHGLSPEEHWGKSVRDIVPQLAPVVEPLLRNIINTGEPAFNIELTVKLSSDPDVSRHLVVSYVPLYGADDKPEGICVLVTEATEREGRRALERPEGSLLNQPLGMLEQGKENLNDKVKSLKDIATALVTAAEILEESKTSGLLSNSDIENGIDFNEEVKRFETLLISRALKSTHGNQKQAALLLKMKHTTLHTKIKRYGITTYAIA